MSKRTVVGTLAQLRSGPGAQRLPVPPLRSIEVQGISSAHADRAHRAFVKTVMPRIKYWNDELDVRFSFAAPASQKSPGEADSVPARVRPSILLHYDGLPTQELNIEGKSASEIVRELQVLARTTAGTPFEEVSEESVDEATVPPPSPEASQASAPTSS